MASPSKTVHSPSPTQPDLSSLLQNLIAALVVARLLVPTEGSVLGDTLWLTPLWFLVVTLWAWDQFRRRDFHIRLDWIDAAVWVIVLGHVVSAISVLIFGGDRRAVLTMTWEWLALGVAFGLIRQLLQTENDRRGWLSALFCLAATLSVYGLWQHYVEFPANVQRVESLEQELAGLGSVPSARAVEIQRELRVMGVPTDGPAKRLWSDRLHSTEPFATFALTNTFAGFLAGWWIIGIGWWWQTRSAGFKVSRVGLVTIFGLLALIGYCLILTKSRTAWAGLLVGSAFLAAMSFRNRAPQVGRWLLYSVGALCVLGVLFTIATLSGGFDREVLSEAPKSLSYRLEYWQGTAAVIQDSPLLGTGPGNFRAAYLQHKLPGASEEIADPHNYLLDLWVSGGLLALLGAGWLAWLTVQRFETIETPTETRSSQTPATWTTIDTGVILGFLLVLGHRFVFLAQFDTRTVWLIGVWLMIRAAWSVIHRSSLPISRLAIGAALVGILVHLLGAGGIEMPAITQLVLLLILLGISSHTRRAVSVVGITFVACSGIAMAVGCVLTSTLPVLQRETQIASGDLAWFENQNFAAATRNYEQAAESDRFSAEPFLRLADLGFQRWAASDRRDEQGFWQAIEYGKKAVERNPANAFTYRSLGRYFFQRYLTTKETADATQAVEYLAKAVERYPTLPAIQAEYAFALHAAGETELARESAKTAIALDDRYRSGGHIDKVLAMSQREELEHIISGNSSTQSAKD